MDIPKRGEYAPFFASGFWSVVWRHAGNQKVLFQFMGPNAAATIARSLNYGVQSALKLAWEVKEPSRIIAPAGFIVGR